MVEGGGKICQGWCDRSKKGREKARRGNAAILKGNIEEPREFSFSHLDRSKYVQ